MRMIVAFLIGIFSVQTCFGWSECGHHLIAVMAFELLEADQQQAILEVLKAHPRFADDFTIPEKAGDNEQWLIGRAAYWPDIARRTPFDRPTWHYQRGASLILGNVASEAPPISFPPPGATLETKDLYIAQAVQLCRTVLKDKTQSPANRAVALCWIGHLIGDAHQPCHAGSLYSPFFADGDRGGNSIPTVQSRNLHALWDGLLGSRFDAGDIKRRALEIKADIKTWDAAKDAASDARGLDPFRWLAESVEFAKSHVYTVEILKTVESVAPKPKSNAIDIAKPATNESPLKQINLPESYLKSAGSVAQKRAAFAAHRLARILASDIAQAK